MTNKNIINETNNELSLEALDSVSGGRSYPTKCDPATMRRYGWDPLNPGQVAFFYIATSINKKKKCLYIG